MGRYLLSYGYIKTKGGRIMLYTKDEYTKHLEELVKYQHAYDIMMDYWDLLPQEALEEMHKRLEGLGL